MFVLVEVIEGQDCMPEVFHTRALADQRFEAYMQENGAREDLREPATTECLRAGRCPGWAVTLWEVEWLPNPEVPVQHEVVIDALCTKIEVLQADLASQARNLEWAHDKVDELNLRLQQERDAFGTLLSWPGSRR